MKRSRAVPLAWAAVAMMTSAPAFACGVCIEDKVAATYDHALVQRAIAHRQQVVFVAIEGSVDGGVIGRSLAGAAVDGVVTGTVRTSAAPAAFSFVLDAKKNPAQAVAGFRKAVRDPRATLTLLRVVRDGRLVEP